MLLLPALTARDRRKRAALFRFCSRGSDLILHGDSPAALPIPDASQHRCSPIRKSMYPSPPLSTRTFFSFCFSISVAAVLGFSEGLSNTLPLRVARTLPRRGQRFSQCLCSTPMQLIHTHSTPHKHNWASQFLLLVKLEVTAI